VADGRGRQACESHGKVDLCLDCSDGRWRVETEDGPAYLIDVPGEWIERHLPGAGRLGRAESRLRLLGLTPVLIGQPLNYVVDGSADGTTFADHQSAEVVSIHRVDPDGLGAWSEPAVTSGGDEDETPGLVYLANGLLTNVHPASACAKQSWGCWIHNPLPHALSHAPVVWRSDRQFAERICEHGIGHPDPQDVLYNRRVLGRDIAVHGCDGCCGALHGWAGYV
jgi:hypothetical protein